MKTKYVAYFDWLRILATIAVIMLHVSAQNWGKVELTSFEWSVFNWFDSACRWSVPIFVMISGALFLDAGKKIEPKKFIKNNCGRIIYAFIFWSGFYAVDALFLGTDIKTATLNFIKGYYHMWFLFMIVGLYIITPILRELTKKKEIVEYFLVVGFVFTFLIPRLFVGIKCLNFPNVTVIVEAFDKAYSNMNFHVTLGYTYYYVLGYYLHNFYEEKKGTIKIWGVISLISYIAIVFMTNWYSIKIGKANTLFYENFSINVLLISIAIFLFGKYRLSKIELGELGKKNLKSLSKYTFGIYLVHAFVIDKLKLLGLNTLTANPIIMICFLTLITAIVSLIISIILNRIPWANKHIV